MVRSFDPFQIFIESPDLNLPSRALTLDNPLHTTIHNLKLSLFPKTQPSQTLTLASLYFTLRGKPLRDDSTVSGSHIAPFSTLTLRVRARGGGGDGGATGAESRDCYLNMYAVKKPDKVDPNEKRLSKWTTCALSFEPLKHPCVVDLLGNVFNKEALVEALLGKKLPKEFGHIRGLRDMVPIQLSAIPGVQSDDRDFVTRFECPITGLEFNGNYKFFALRKCGHVVSAKALKEVKSTGCLVCHEEFTDSDKIVINGSEEEVATLRERMEEEKAAKLREKKAKKVKSGEVGAVGHAGVSLPASQVSGAKRTVDDKDLEKAKGKVEVSKMIGNGGVVVKAASNGQVKRFKAGDRAPAHANKEVYASIFTSSRKSDFKETYSCRSLPLGRN